MSGPTRVFYSAERCSPIDEINPATGCSVVGGEDLEAIRRRYPDAVVMPWSEALAMMEAAYTTEWAEIDEAAFTDALEVLPPVGWRTVCGVESFKMSERLIGSITSLYARRTGRYFRRNASIYTSAEQIALEVEAL